MPTNKDQVVDKLVSKIITLMKKEFHGHVEISFHGGEIKTVKTTQTEHVKDL